MQVKSQSQITVSHLALQFSNGDVPVDHTEFWHVLFARRCKKKQVGAFNVHPQCLQTRASDLE